MRYRLRTIFIVVAIMAILCAWFKAQTTTRYFELSRIEEIRNIADHPLFIGDGGHPFGGCGTYQGIIIYVDDCGPSILKRFKLDCLKRVTGIEMKCRNNPKILELAQDFSSLKDVCAEKDTPNNQGFIAAINKLRSKRPLVSVDYWHSKY